MAVSVPIEYNKSRKVRRHRHLKKIVELWRAKRPQSPHIAPRLRLACAVSGGEYAMLIQFFHEDDGQTLVEYGLLISLIALVVLAAVAVFGNKVAGMWGKNAERFPDPPNLP